MSLHTTEVEGVEPDRTDLEASESARTAPTSPPSNAVPQTGAPPQAGGETDPVPNVLMGPASVAAGVIGENASAVRSTISDDALMVDDTVAAAPSRAKQQTQRRSLAAGLIAFGAGTLLGSLLPAIGREREAVADRSG